MSRPIAPVLDHYLAAPMDLIKEVHTQLPAILRVAEHLTPVEDLLDFKQQIEDIHGKLMLLVAASELILRATPPGIDMLTAATIEAQRELLKLKSAALREETYFATAAEMSEARARLHALEAAMATVQAEITTIWAELEQKIDREEFEARLGDILGRIQEIEDWIGPSLGSIDSRITELIGRLENGEFGEALARALQELTVRVEETETGLLSEARQRTELETSVLDLKNQVAGNSQAHQTLVSRVESGEGFITSLSQDLTELRTEVTDLATGQSAHGSAIQNLESRSSITEGQVEQYGEFLTRLEGEIDDTRHQVGLQSAAISGLTSRMTSSEEGQLILLNDTSQLNARLTDAETGLVSAGEALSQLSTRIEANDAGLEIVSEDVTRLTASLGGGGNLLVNAAFEADTYGWSFISKGAGWLASQLQRNLYGMVPEGANALSLTANGVPAGVVGVRSQRLPLEQAKQYILSTCLAAENCTARLEWRIYGLDGQELEYGLVAESNHGPGTLLSEWERQHDSTVAPEEGSTLELQLWVSDCHTDVPGVWLLRPMVEETSTSQLGPSPWTPGMAGTDAKYAEATALLSSRIDVTEEAVTVLSEDVVNLRAQIDNIGDISGLDELRTQITQNADGITLLGEQLTGLTAVLDGKASGEALDALEIRITEIDGDIESLSSSVTSLNNAIYDQTDGLAAKASASALSSLESTVTELGETLLSASSAITSLENVLNHPTTGLGSKASSSALNQLATRVTAVESTATDTTQLKTRLDTVEASLIQEMITSSQNDTAHTSAISLLETRLDNAETGISANASGLSGLTNRVTSVEGKTTANSSHLTQLQAQVNALDVDAGGSGQAISELDTRVTTVENTVTSHGTAITALQNSVTSANKVFVQDNPPSVTGRTHGDLWIDSNDSNKLHSYDSTLNQWVPRVDGGKNTIFVQGTQPVAKAVNDLWFDTSRNNRQFRWNGTAWVEVTDTRTLANVNAISGLTTRVSNAEGTLSSQGSHLTQLQAQVNALDVDAGGSGSAIAALDTRVTAAEGRITSQGSSITALENKVNHSTTGLSATVSGLNALTTRVTSAEGKITSQGSSITSLESKVNHSTTGLAATASNVSALTTRVSTAEGKINSQASSISTLSTTVGSHTTTITSHTSSINGLQGKAGVTINANGHITGWALNNNGKSGIFTIQADKFQIIAPGSGARTEFSNGNWRVYDANGVLRVRMGVW